MFITPDITIKAMLGQLIGSLEHQNRKSKGFRLSNYTHGGNY